MEKYRGYLNFHYGVTVEETLQLAVEQEVIKRRASNGLRRGERADRRGVRADLRSRAGGVGGAVQREAAGEDGQAPPLSEAPMSLSECKEFTYWLFKLRLWRSASRR